MSSRHQKLHPNLILGASSPQQLSVTKDIGRQTGAKTVPPRPTGSVSAFEPSPGHSRAR